MQKQTYKEDGGEEFGRWTDSVSQLMYQDIMPLVVNQIAFIGTIADYGGANGISKEFIPGVITIDIDESKKPDIVDNIITHNGNYDTVLIRYVLHYLSDEQIAQMLSNIQGKLVVIQFTNEQTDLDVKNQISDGNEANKHFRTKEELFALFTGFTIVKAIEVSYIVDPQFYKNRLGIDTELSHSEQIQIIEMEKT